MKKYDGWTLQNNYGRKSYLVLEYLRKTRREVINQVECELDDHWENVKKRLKFKVVKVKLVEVK